MRTKMSLLLLMAGVFWFLFSLYQRFFPSTPPSPPVPKGGLVVSNVYVESVDLLQMHEPPSLIAIVKGSLPDPCQVVDEIKFYAQDNLLNYIITASKPNDAACDLNHKNFEQEIEVDITSLEPGTYILNINSVENIFTIPPTQ